MSSWFKGISFQVSTNTVLKFSDGLIQVKSTFSKYFVANFEDRVEMQFIFSNKIRGKVHLENIMPMAVILPK